MCCPNDSLRQVDSTIDTRTFALPPLQIYDDSWARGENYVKFSRFHSVIKEVKRSILPQLGRRE